MKTITTTVSCLLLLAMLSCKNDNKTDESATPVTDTTAKTDNSASTASNPAAAPMDSAAMAKAWEAYMTPGDMHKWMASTDGKWEAEMTFWMGPGAPPS